MLRAGIYSTWYQVRDAAGNRRSHERTRYELANMYVPGEQQHNKLEQAVRYNNSKHSNAHVRYDKISTCLVRPELSHRAQPKNMSFEFFSGWKFELLIICPISQLIIA